MSKRYIDADDLIGQMHFIQFADGADRSLVYALIDRQPTADVVDRKRGKWLINKGLYECSSCHQLWTEWWAISKPIERMKKECPYCPMCGSYNGEETDDGGKSEE